MTDGAWGDLIDFKATDDAEPIIVPAPRRYDLSECKHDRGVIDQQARTLTCRACGVPLDPIDFIAKIAHYGTQMQWRQKAAEEAVRKLNERTSDKLRRGHQRGLHFTQRGPKKGCPLCPQWPTSWDWTSGSLRMECRHNVYHPWPVAAEHECDGCCLARKETPK